MCEGKVNPSLEVHHAASSISGNTSYNSSTRNKGKQVSKTPIDKVSQFFKGLEGKFEVDSSHVRNEER